MRYAIALRLSAKILRRAILYLFNNLIFGCFVDRDGIAVLGHDLDLVSAGLQRIALEVDGHLDVAGVHTFILHTVDVYRSDAAIALEVVDADLHNGDIIGHNLGYVAVL